MLDSAKTVFFIAIAMLCVPLNQSSAFAEMLTEGNLLITRQQAGIVGEYTPSGELIQAFGVRSPDVTRGVAVDREGVIQLYAGTFNPYLATIDPVRVTLAEHTFPGWSTVNNTTYGAVGAAGESVFVTDNATGGGGAAKGIIRFDRNDFSATRFATSGDYRDLTIGLGGGLLYALASPNNTVDIFDPQSLAFLGSVVLGGDEQIRGIAVDFNGDFFATRSAGTLDRYNSAGVIVASVRTIAQQGFSDIALSRSGRVAAVTTNGIVILTDRDFTEMSSFTVSTDVLHVAFVPEPSSVVLAAIGLIGLAAWGWQRKR